MPENKAFCSEEVFARTCWQPSIHSQHELQQHSAEHTPTIHVRHAGTQVCAGNAVLLASCSQHSDAAQGAFSR